MNLFPFLLLVPAALGRPAGPTRVPPKPRKVQTDAAVKFVNLAPDSPSVTVRVNGAEEVKTLAFGETSKGEHLAPGACKVEFRSGEKSLLTAPLDLRANQDYAVALLGEGANRKVETLQPTWEKGRAHVFVENASPETGPVEVLLAGKPIGGSKSIAPWARASETTDPGHPLIEVKAGAKTIVSKEENLRGDHCYIAILAGKPAGTPTVQLAWMAFSHPKA